MPKVLAQAGTSLADIYDVEGSIAGVEEIDSREVHLLHEMGALLFSEQLVGRIERTTTGATPQNTTWDLAIPLPAGLTGVFRVLGVYVQTDLAGRVNNVQVSLRSVALGREVPVFLWDTTNDVESDVRIVDNDAAAAAAFALVQTTPQVMPSLGVGLGQREQVGDEIVFRGLTSGFGAGNVIVVALVYLASLRTTAVSSVGLPIPGW